MNKQKLIAAIAEKAGLTKKDAEKALNATVEAITETLAKKEKIQLVGFGVFETRERAERTALNPRTKERVALPASTNVKFSPGKKLKEVVNQ